MGQVVEHDHQVGLEERGRGRPDRVALRQRDGRLEDRHRVVGERPDAAAGEARHALGRGDAATRDELADRLERIGRRRGLDREVGVVGRDVERARLDAGEAVAHLEQAPRPGPEEGVAPEPLAAFDRLEEVRRAAVVQAQEGTDRRLEVGRPGRAQQDRVRVRREALGLGQAERLVGAHRVGASRIRNDPSSRDERPCLPRCHPHSALPHLRDRQSAAHGRRPIGAARYRWRSAPEPTDACGEPLRVRSGGSRVHSPSSPSRLAPTAGSLSRRATGTRPVHSPLFVMWRGVWAGSFRGRQARRGALVRARIVADTNSCGANAELRAPTACGAARHARRPSPSAGTTRVKRRLHHGDC